MGRWIFGEGSGTQVLDITGHGFNGSFGEPPYNNLTWLSPGEFFFEAPVISIVDGALGFAGNSYLRFDDLHFGTTQGAIDIWFRIEELRSSRIQELIAIRRVEDRRSFFRIRILDTGTIQCEWSANPVGEPSSILTLPPPLQLNLHQMAHLVCQYGPDGTKMYFNSNLVSNDPAVIQYTGEPTFSEIGVNILEQNDFLSGLVDELILYDRTLRPDEVVNAFRSHPTP